MTESVLVTYATRYGSTRDVAERVGTTLRDRGLSVEVRSVDSVSDLTPYGAVVLGAPYFLGKMLKDATRFLERQRSALEAMPVALFALGPVTPDEDLDEVRGQLDKTLAKLGWLRPVATEMFGGKYDPTVLRGLDKLITKPPASPMHGLGAHDYRDWEAIERWATSLPLTVAQVASA